MNTWHITLPDELAQFVNQQLTNKAWGSPDNLFGAAVMALLNQIEFEDSIDKDWLRKELQPAIDQADRGELVDADELFDRLHQELTNAEEACLREELQRAVDQANREEMVDNPLLVAQAARQDQGTG